MVHYGQGSYLSQTDRMIWCNREK